jgi:hypothetical protein
MQNIQKTKWCCIRLIPLQVFPSEKCHTTLNILLALTIIRNNEDSGLLVCSTVLLGEGIPTV